MDQFEAVIGTVLEHKGYWVRRGFKVNLTKADKKELKNRSMPRPEIDLLAFKPKENAIIAFEAKSFLNSPGVKSADITNENLDLPPEGRYKMFTSNKYRGKVLQQLKKDLIKDGLATKDTKIVLGLIAGNVCTGQEATLAKHMKKKRWEFWGPSDLKEHVQKLKKLNYENSPAIIVSKILLR